MGCIWDRALFLLVATHSELEMEKVRSEDEKKTKKQSLNFSVISARLYFTTEA